MGLRKLFKTNTGLETSGVVIEYSDVCRIRIARAGGGNKRYAKAVEKATRPYRRAIAAGSFSEEKANEILMAVYAETVVLDWQVKRGEEWLSGIDPEDVGQAGAELLPVTAENVVAAFKYLPDLYLDLMQQAQSIALFRDEVNEAAGGNS